jgi:Fe2+ or Zn2+ uptake regulation protein
MPLSLLSRLNTLSKKITVPRRAIATWIDAHEGVFSAKEILSELPLDKVSVYRTLELFTELDLIHPVLMQHGEQHYERHDLKHHHHVVCSSCEKSACVGCEVKEEKRFTGFTHIHHTLVFTGLCTTCA